MHNDLLIIVFIIIFSKNYFILSNGHLGADSILWRRFKTILQLLNNKLSKKYFHQSWNINCPILFNTISFYTEMISISLFLGFHIELNILGTRDISCVLHEIQIWNTNLQVNLTGIKRQCPNFITDRFLLLSATSTTKVHHRLWIVMQLVKKRPLQTSGH